MMLPRQLADWRLGKDYASRLSMPALTFTWSSTGSVYWKSK